MKPERIQLSRRKGWRMPPNTVNCARPGKHGNPFRIGAHMRIGDYNPRAVLRMSYMESYKPDPAKGFEEVRDQAHAVEMFKKYAANWSPEWLAKVRAELGGKHLACWCKPGTPCHADVLLELVNPAGKPVN